MFLHGKLVFNENSPRFRAGQILFKNLYGGKEIKFKRCGFICCVFLERQLHLTGRSFFDCVSENQRLKITDQ